MGQKIRKIQIGTTVLEQVIEVPDPVCEVKPKRRGRKPKATDAIAESPASDEKEELAHEAEDQLP